MFEIKDLLYESMHSPVQLHFIDILEEELSGSEANAAIFKSEAFETTPLVLLNVNSKMVGRHETWIDADPVIANEPRNSRNSHSKGIPCIQIS